MLLKNDWAATFFERLNIPVNNKVAAILELDRQPLSIDNNPHARRQTHKIVCVRQRIRLVKIVHAPAQTPLGVAPGPEAVDVQISRSKNLWRVAQIGAHLRPKLRPSVKCPP